MWNEISSQEDVNNLLELFGYFHDAPNAEEYT